MIFKQQLIEELQCIDKPNEFEKFIADNSSKLQGLSEDELSMLIMLKKTSKRLCTVLPYRKKTIYEMVECSEVGLQSDIGELYNMFNVAENIFEKSRENTDK